MKIFFVIDQMIGGGAAKKSSIIANELAAKGYEVFFATNIHKPIVYKLSEKIKLISIYNNSNSLRLFRLFSTMRNLKQAVKEYSPNVVVSFLPHVSCLTKIALLGVKIPIVFSDETSFARKESLLLSYLRKHFYRYCDALVVLTQNDCNILGKKFPQKIAIHNPVIIENNNPVEICEREKRIVVIGQTNRWWIKGLDIAIGVWSMLAKEFPEWSLAIVGDVEPKSKAYLMEIASKASIEQQVQFLGFTNDIRDVFGNAQVFMMTSRFEGFSLSLIEALICGVPGLSFSEYGVVEEVSCGGKGVVIIQDGDVEGLQKALKSLLLDSDKRQALSKEGLTIASQYHPDTIVDQWECLFKSLSKIKV